MKTYHHSLELYLPRLVSVQSSPPSEFTSTFKSQNHFTCVARNLLLLLAVAAVSPAEPSPQADVPSVAVAGASLSKPSPQADVPSVAANVPIIKNPSFNPHKLNRRVKPRKLTHEQQSVLEQAVLTKISKCTDSNQAFADESPSPTEIHSNAKNATDEAEQVTYANTEVPISVEYSDDPPDGMTEGSVSSSLLKEPSTFDNSISKNKPTEKLKTTLLL